MQQLVRRSANAFLLITIVTALFALVGLAIQWYLGDEVELPFLRWLLSAVLFEIVAITFAFTKRGMRYIPRIVNAKTETASLEVMSELVSTASSVAIYSNRASYLANSIEFQDALVTAALRGAKVELIIRSIGSQQELLHDLVKRNVVVLLVSNDDIPFARFTLVNEHRTSGERLAIARGSYPAHDITIYDHESGPQVVALARELVRHARKQSVVWNGES